MNYFDQNRGFVLQIDFFVVEVKIKKNAVILGTAGHLDLNGNYLNLANSF